MTKTMLRKTLIGLLLGGGLVCWVYIAVGLTFRAIEAVESSMGMYILTRARPASLKEISYESGIVFPESASLEGSQFVPGGMDFSIYAKVRIDREDVDWFMENGLSKATKEKPVFSKDYKMPADFAPPGRRAAKWWKPESVQDWVGTRFERDQYQNRTVYLLIDLDQGEHATLYILLIQS